MTNNRTAISNLQEFAKDCLTD